MRTKWSGVVVLAIVMAISVTAMAQDNEDGFVSLFDGETLNGWTKKGGPATYRVEDGCIVGERQPGATNTFLCTEKEFGNFILKLDFRVEIPGNSGVQFRSHSRPEG
ncbi:MAG: DUF1080 domain-containing protein, partial [Planctomycetia bacterium]|nr:DUF1080 domain-containing protein [Planctomycetia bacterium]